MLNQDLWVSLERDLINAPCCTHFCSVMIYIQKDIAETKEQKEKKLKITSYANSKALFILLSTYSYSPKLKS